MLYSATHAIFKIASFAHAHLTVADIYKTHCDHTKVEIQESINWPIERSKNKTKTRVLPLFWPVSTFPKFLLYFLNDPSADVINCQATAH